MSGSGSLLAISDLHVAFDNNRAVLEGLRPDHPDDWLLVAGAVGEIAGDIGLALELLRRRFAKVVWVPGNHELWTHRQDPVTLRGRGRYEHLVRICRDLGVLTPEDPYPVWQSPTGPVTVAPLFVLYDYTFRCLIARSSDAGSPVCSSKGSPSRAAVISFDRLLSASPTVMNDSDFSRPLTVHRTINGLRRSGRSRMCQKRTL